MEDKKNDLFRRLITLAPSNSLLQIDGFCDDFIAETSYQKLFQYEDVSMQEQMKSHIIPLTNNRRQALTDILDIEGSNLIAYMTHFCISDNFEIFAACYDSMNVIQIKKTTFSGLDDLIASQFSELGIILSDKLIDCGFLTQYPNP